MADEEAPSEALSVIQWRFEQAREAGLTRIEARLWAESEADVGELRKLVAKEAKPQQIAKIVL